MHEIAKSAKMLSLNFATLFSCTKPNPPANLTISEQKICSTSTLPGSNAPKACLSSSSATRREFVAYDGFAPRNRSFTVSRRTQRRRIVNYPTRVDRDLRSPNVICAKSATDFVDFYEVLGVTKDSDEKTIKSRYRELARKFHPDVNKDPAAEEKFKKINEAYEVLGDPDRRKKYDAFGQYYKYADRGNVGGVPPGVDFGDFSQFGNFEDFLADLLGRFGGAGSRGGAQSPFDFGGFGGFGGQPNGFGGNGFGGAAAARSQPETVQDISISLSEAYRGTERTVTLQSQQVIGQMAMPKQENLQVQIPAGVTPGTKIRITRSGSVVYLRINILPHPFFKLDEIAPSNGADSKSWRMECEVPVTPDEAVLGTAAQVRTPDGKLVELSIPAGVKSGQALRLRGKGWPNRKGGDPGDLYARVQIVPPPASALSEEEKNLYQKLKEARTYNPRDQMTSSAL
mmetsp:Transcript_31717/g.51173  ORF Transcript_31717/g.51173 Transcript_31717/m.51173 type:complete len:456 (-) Transcript_31717:68-1435(-)